MGDKFRSNFSKGDTKVAITLENNNQVVHIKSKKENYYVVVTDKGEMKFDKIGTGVPDLVDSLINISEVNIQQQLDQPFLATSSSGEIFRTISKITKIDQATSWIQSLNKQINEQRYKQTNIKDDIAEIDSKFDALEDLDELGETINELSEVQKEIKHLETSYYEIQDLLAKIKEDEHIMSLNRAYQNVKRKVKKIQRLKNKIGKLRADRVLANETKKLHQEISVHKRRKKLFVSQYIDELKKNKRCPTCFLELSQKALRRVTIEVNRTNK